MTVRVHGKNMHVAEGMREIAEDRVEHAGRFFENGGDVDVEFTENHNPRRVDERFRVEITTTAGGRIVRAEAEADAERTALDLAADTYERQLRKLKARLIQRNRVSKKELNRVSSQPDDDGDHGVEIVRTKRFLMKPMSAEEAVLQMEMLGHEFFFFLDADTDRHGVVYRRRDGKVGLIESE